MGQSLFISISIQNWQNIINSCINVITILSMLQDGVIWQFVYITIREEAEIWEMSLESKSTTMFDFTRWIIWDYIINIKEYFDSFCVNCSILMYVTYFVCITLLHLNFWSILLYPSPSCFVLFYFTLHSSATY